MRHNAHSLSPQPFINENTGFVLHAASAKRRDADFSFSVSVSYVSVSAYLLISPRDGAITALPRRLGNLVQIMACLRGLQLSLSVSQKALALEVGRARWTFGMIAASSFSSGFFCSSSLAPPLPPETEDSSPSEPLTDRIYPACNVAPYLQLPKIGHMPQLSIWELE